MPTPFLRPASSYDELWRQVDFANFEIPDRFNIGTACVDVQDPAARALTIVDLDRTSRDYTFGDVADQSNRLANALSAIGIGVGDVVGVVNPASLETAISYMALFRMGAVALPMSEPHRVAWRL